MDAAATGIGIYGSGTGMSVQYTGSNWGFDIRPPFFALCFIMYLGG
jgi:hypothetical protein